MALIKLRAVKPLSYARQRIPAGAEFSATPREARVLTAIKRAVLIKEALPEPLPLQPEKPKRKPRASKAVTIVADDTAADTAPLLEPQAPAEAALPAEPDAAPAPAPGSYMRRDLTAED